MSDPRGAYSDSPPTSLPSQIPDIVGYPATSADPTFDNDVDEEGRIRQHSGAGLLANAVPPSSLPPLDSVQPAVPAPRPPFTTKQNFSGGEFVAIVDEVRAAIAAGIQPLRIAQGSSGSYFCKNKEGVIVGVFKPKNEEPYGQLNPKWTKWLHKTCCPCCFGRGCLIANNGYISEAAASLIDRHLGLNVVPRTEIVSLSSPSFFYSYIDKSQSRRAGGALPAKVGSFQLFMHGYMDATKFLKEGPQMLRDGRLKKDDETGGLHSSLQKQFQDQFERLVILDYIIRNTDRGLDNWMVRYEEPVARESKEDGEQDLMMVSSSHLYIAAIDNGLAFPFKHPDQWRSYPYGWSFLPASRVPFSKETRERLLPMLTSKTWWDNLIRDLRVIFSLDQDFDEKLFRRQVAIIKGQVYNLVRVLQTGVDGQLSYSATSAAAISSPSQSPLTHTVNVESSLLSASVKTAGTISGTPLDLVNQPCCLVWEDADVRDLAGGRLGVDVMGRDGLLGTIIGGADAAVPPPTRKSPSLVIEIPERRDSRGALTVPVTPIQAKVVGDFLTSPAQMAALSSSYDPGYLHGNDKEELESHRIRSHSPGRRRLRMNPAELGHNLDAFRGKVITFVKSQPWFRNW